MKVTNSWWFNKVQQAEIRLDRKDIETKSIAGGRYPSIKTEVLKDTFPIFKAAHVLRILNVPQAIKESADNCLHADDLDKATRALQYFSISRLTDHILEVEPEFLGEELGVQFLPNAEIYNVTRKTATHCHGRTFYGSFFCLSYGSNTKGVKSSGGLTLYLLEDSVVKKTPDFFVKDDYHDFYLKRQFWDQVPSIDLPPTTSDTLLVIHDGATAHSNMKVELNPGSVRTIGFFEMCPVNRLDPKYLSKLTSLELAQEQRNSFIAGKIVGVLNTCPET